jgi:DNA-binding LacI/PurR family transcriptional regulator
VVVPNYYAWRFFLTSPHFNRFFARFREELNEFGLDWSVAFAHKSGRGTTMFPSGMNEVLSMATAQSDGYRGLLVAGNLSNTRNWREWLVRFKSTGKPSVFYCSDGTTARSISDVSLPKNCFRAFFDERAAEALVLSRLVQAGHREAVYIRTDADEGNWQTRRHDGLRETGARHTPSLGMRLVDESERLAGDGTFPDTSMMELAAGGRRAGVEPLERSRLTLPRKAAQKALRQGFSHLARLLGRRGTTAVMAPNDAHAANIMLSLGILGVRIPKDMSLVSFDNDPLTAHYPITTVDLGLQGLAYSLAHLFIGDIPVASDKNRNIVSKPFMSDRGSVGPAPRR